MSESLENQRKSNNHLSNLYYMYATGRLSLKGEAGAELVARLVQLLGIERAANTKGQAAVDLGVVGEGCDAEVVDLGLGVVSRSSGPTVHLESTTYLGERRRVKLVLGSQLKTNVGAGLGVPGSAGTGLDGGVDPLIVRGGEDAQGVGCGDGSVVERGGVSDGSGVLGDGSLLHIVANLTTNDETLVADNGIGNGADSTGSRVVDKGAAVEVGLLEVEVDLLALVAGSGVEVGENLSLQAAGEGVVELDLGSQQVGGVPRLGDADACTVGRQQADSVASHSKSAGRLRHMKYIRRKPRRRMTGYHQPERTRGY